MNVFPTCVGMKRLRDIMAGGSVFPKRENEHVADLINGERSVD